MTNIEKFSFKNYRKSTDDRRKKARPKTKRFIWKIIIISLLIGIVGGVLGTILMTTVGKGFLKSLGVGDEISIPSLETKRIVLEETSAITEAVEQVKPAVVSIIAEEQITDIFGQVSTQRAGGSGFIITSDGLIVTNKHVVSQKNWQYFVYLNDGSKHKAKIKSRDPFNDLAVLEIEANNLPVVELGSNEEISVGQYIIAIGNALGEFQNTVTLGVVSAKERRLEAQGSTGESEYLEGLIQVDAAINSGNSGGPLINLAGQVVGVNVAKAEEADNIGFAIPVEVAKSAIDSLKEYGKIVRPYMGIQYVSLSPEVADQNDLKTQYGAMIYASDLSSPIMPGSPAKKAGLKDRDIILKIDDQKIDANHSLSRILQSYSPGDKITVTYLRNNKERQTELKLARNDQF